ncbi:thiosulfate dehydrogenase [Thalassobacillus cyri]|uniref:Thiosulfate dehydrogenase n=1 Tax=Thalassobacillus cyri TaxID=571932 RepID=A0A1H3W3L6_9BACI|nr:c-type cytochrome [Thalassobacillus cyri]SDZ81646.1 thiosulfate dehydrogenase [Thalassobacillus cyri]
MSCHASDGSGTGPNSGPELWGENSFNDGAGMTYLSKMAGFVKRNMPIGQENSLTDQEAADVSAYILSHERPLYQNHEKDFPHGGRPDDQMNKERREQIRNGNFDWSTIDNIVMPSEQN